MTLHCLSCSVDFIPLLKRKMIGNVTIIIGTSLHAFMQRFAIFGHDSFVNHLLDIGLIVSCTDFAQTAKNITTTFRRAVNIQL